MVVVRCQFVGATAAAMAGCGSFTLAYLVGGVGRADCSRHLHTTVEKKYIAWCPWCFKVTHTARTGICITSQIISGFQRFRFFFFSCLVFFSAAFLIPVSGPVKPRACCEAAPLYFKQMERLSKDM